MPSLVWYVSGHGFGHASRSIAVINALVDHEPSLHMVVRSQVPRWLIERTARPGVELEPVETDTGVVQMDSLRLDAAETIARADAFMTTWPERVAAERAALERLDARLVVSDIPPLAIAAAHDANLPAVALGNFTWDWIYSWYEGGNEVAERISGIYAKAALALRLPMWGGFATIPNVIDVPLVARRSTRDAHQVRKALGLPQDRPLVLASFGGHGLSGFDLAALRSIDGYTILLPGDIDEPAMYDKGFLYEDLIGAVDVVVTKPGYGIISECAANGPALLYTSRGDFREYDVLVKAMPSIVRCGFIDHDDLFSGNWKPHLDDVLAKPRPACVRVDGAEVAAAHLLNLLR